MIKVILFLVTLQISSIIASRCRKIGLTSDSRFEFFPPKELSLIKNYSQQHEESRLYLSDLC